MECHLGALCVEVLKLEFERVLMVEMFYRSMISMIPSHSRKKFSVCQGVERPV